MSDLLAEFDGVHVPNYRAEFDLLRIGGGLIDLKHAVMDWSPVRTYAALRRFERLMESLIAAPSGLGRFFTTGFSYASRFPNIQTEVERFVRDIVAVSWETPWPYADIEDGPVATFRRKLLGRVGRQTMRQYRLVSRDTFLPAAQRFVASLLWWDIPGNRTGWVAVHNALEPFDPAANLDLLGSGSRSIVVDRDPRDIYATAITTQQGFNDNLALYRRIAGADDVETFIRRHAAYRAACAPEHPAVLRLRFEDLVGQYDATRARIAEFLDLDPMSQREPRQCFDPAKAVANVGLWMRPELQEHAADFERIASAAGV